MLLQEFKTLLRLRVLLWVLTRREVSARQAGTAVGTLWAYLQPLLVVAAYYLVFDVVFSMRLGEAAPVRAVGAYLIVGSLPWMGFCDAVSRGMASLIEAGSVLQKNALPFVLFPARSVLASAVVYGPLIGLLVFAYIPLHHFSPSLMAMAPLLLLQLILCTSLGYLLAIFAAALRDIIQIVGFLLSVGIYLSPVLFPLSLFPANWQWVLWLNPMTALVIGYQTVLLQGTWPAWTIWAVTGTWISLILLLLNVVIRRSRDQLVDWL